MSQLVFLLSPGEAAGCFSRAASAQLGRMLCSQFDYDDLMAGIVALLAERPELCARYRRAYTHVLVDEFQDTNAAQYRLIHQLIGQEVCSSFCTKDATLPSRSNVLVGYVSSIIELRVGGPSFQGQATSVAFAKRV